MADLYKEYGLNEDTIEFIGHSLALHRDDAYLTQPAQPTVMKVRILSSGLYLDLGLKGLDQGLDWKVVYHLVGSKLQTTPPPHPGCHKGQAVPRLAVAVRGPQLPLPVPALRPRGAASGESCRSEGRRHQSGLPPT